MSCLYGLPGRSKGLIETFLTDELAAKDSVEVAVAELKDKIDALDRKRIYGCAVQIESDEVGRQIADLEKDNKKLIRDKEDRERDLEAI